jgi:TolB protein
MKQSRPFGGLDTEKRVLWLWLALMLAAPAWGQLRLDITQGVRDAVPIAIVPFAGQSTNMRADVAAVVANDLRLSGRFAPLERADLVSQPANGAAIRFEDWRLLKSDFIVVGQLSRDAVGGESVAFELYNVRTGQQLLADRLAVTEQNARLVGHRIADLVFEKLTGIPGAFATRIAYVSVDGRAPNQHYRLMVADADGYGARTVTESTQPLMSPAWSADGQFLAYVSFESGRSSVYVQRLSTGERSRVSARSGINGAPTFSPDGRRLALTLSRDGDLDIYVLELSNQSLTRVTASDAIDTEPEWSRDGGVIYFTSDRAGSPQIYKTNLDGSKTAQRVTFTNAYNARPRLSPDGNSLALVTLDGGGYRIGLYDLRNRSLRVLTGATQDEAPSFGPNGAAIIYATRERGRGGLAMVSTDGRLQQRLTADQGDVRDPAWSPLLQR